MLKDFHRRIWTERASKKPNIIYSKLHILYKSLQQNESASGSVRTRCDGIETLVLRVFLSSLLNERRLSVHASYAAFLIGDRPLKKDLQGERMRVRESERETKGVNEMERKGGSEGE